MDGISDISISQDEERHFTVTAVKSSGEKSERTFSVPVMIYRDIFKEGQKYYPGTASHGAALSGTAMKRRAINLVKMAQGAGSWLLSVVVMRG